MHAHTASRQPMPVPEGGHTNTDASLCTCSSGTVSQPPRDNGDAIQTQEDVQTRGRCGAGGRGLPLLVCGLWGYQVKKQATFLGKTKRTSLPSLPRFIPLDRLQHIDGGTRRSRDPSVRGDRGLSKNLAAIPSFERLRHGETSFSGGNGGRGSSRGRGGGGGGSPVGQSNSDRQLVPQCCLYRL